MKIPKIGQAPIDQAKVLVVEGVEDGLFLYAFLKHLSITNIQIISSGKTELKNHLPALAKDPYFIANTQALAVIRDADNNASAAFESVCTALERANLPVPVAVLQPAGTKPIVRVMIVPHGKTSGMLEDICLDTVSTDPASSCVDSYFNCLSSIPGFTLPNNMSKAKVYAFLSSRIEPDKRLGEAAEAGYWPFNNTACDSLKAFLSSM